MPLSVFWAPSLLLEELLDVLRTLLAVQGGPVGATLLEERIQDLVHLLGADLELVVEGGIAHVALRVDEVLDALDEQVVVDLAEVVALEEGTDVHAHQVAGGIDLFGGRKEGLHFSAALHLGSAASHDQHGGRCNGDDVGDLHDTLF